jgi:MarR family transcriptional regulator, 2-MHQ and catechol-resistance regulon repressor
MRTKGIHLWLLLWKASRTVEARAQRSVAGLSDFGVKALLHKGPLPVNVLGRKVLLTSGSMTAAVDRLEKRGLLRRQDDPEDRRSRVIHLTDAGRELISRLFAEHAASMEQAMAFLSDDEMNALAAGLRRLGRGVEEQNKKENADA